ncbi:MAG: hypothetical protein RR014_02130 [Bilophila sp.]
MRVALLVALLLLVVACAQDKDSAQVRVRGQWDGTVIMEHGK